MYNATLGAAHTQGHTTTVYECLPHGPDFQDAIWSQNENCHESRNHLIMPHADKRLYSLSATRIGERPWRTSSQIALNMHIAVYTFGDENQANVNLLLPFIHKMKHNATFEV